MPRRNAKPRAAAKAKVKPKPKAAPVPAPVPPPEPTPEPIVFERSERFGRKPEKFKGISLTQAMADAILRDVTAGGYPLHVAVQHGIPRTTWWDWMKRGRGGLLPNRVEAPENLVAFVAAVDQAAAQAMNVASMEVYRDNKLAWLLKGPGRERSGHPGWADKTAPDVEIEPKGDAGGDRPAVMALFEEIKDRLTDEEMRRLLALGREKEAKAD